MKRKRWASDDEKAEKKMEERKMSQAFEAVLDDHCVFQRSYVLIKYKNIGHDAD